MSFTKGNDVTICDGCKIGDDVILEDSVYLDYNVIIRDGVTVKKGTYIGANSILGEYQSDWYKNRSGGQHPLIIGENSLIRSGAILYSGSNIGSHFQSGHNVTIREKTTIGDHCSIGTLSDIQGDCTIGNYVRLHSNVHISMKSNIKDFVWIYPYVVLLNDPSPPSEILLGVTIESFAIIAVNCVILPGVHIDSDTLVATGAIVTKDVEKNTIVGGNPAKPFSTIDRIKHKLTGENIYPWRYSFERGMPWAGIGYDEWIKLTGSNPETV